MERNRNFSSICISFCFYIIQVMNETNHLSFKKKHLLFSISCLEFKCNIFARMKLQMLHGYRPGCFLYSHDRILQLANSPDHIIMVKH